MKKPSKNKKIKQNGVSIKISSLGNSPPQIQIDSFGESKREEPGVKNIKEMPSKIFSMENQKKVGKLPKKEPRTNIKRFSDKVIYEIEIPGVESIEDVSIVKLESSIEIKAITKDKVYFKLIPIGLPITNYNLEKGKLVLELGE